MARSERGDQCASAAEDVSQPRQASSSQHVYNAPQNPVQAPSAHDGLPTAEDAFAATGRPFGWRLRTSSDDGLGSGWRDDNKRSKEHAAGDGDDLRRKKRKVYNGSFFVGGETSKFIGYSEAQPATSGSDKFSVVSGWRVQLQKLLLTDRKTKREDVENAVNLLNTIEQSDMQAAWLRESLSGLALSNY
ncbi:hypothetical protein JCM10296v2_001805 [Rhodotorula toruloides]